MRFRRTLTATVLPMLLWVGFAGSGSGAEGSSQIVGFRLDPAKTWVGLARVHLEVADLEVSGHQLVGDYRIKVPIRPSKNDEGSIHLRLGSSIDELRQDGGILLGHAVSEVNGETHDVECRIERDGSVTIDVTTAKRTMSFRSRYVPLSGA